MSERQTQRRAGVSATQRRALEALAGGGTIDRWGTVRGGERVFQLKPQSIEGLIGRGWITKHGERWVISAAGRAALRDEIEEAA